jgi:UDP-glucose 4-epimerase
MKILILGGLGYVGSRLSAYLKTEGLAITLAVRQNKQMPNWISQMGINTFTLNMADLNELSQAIPNFDLIINLIAANEMDAAANPAVAFEHTAVMAYNVTKNLKNDAKLIHFSTFHVYGRSHGKISEATCPLPNHPYGVAHLAAEGMIRGAKKEQDVMILRMGNAFGYPQDLNIASRWNLLVNDLCKQAVENKQIVLKSSGLQMRNFIPLAAVTESIAQWIQTFPTSGTYNFVSPISTSVLSMAELVQKRAEVIFNQPIALLKPSATDANSSTLEIESSLNISEAATNQAVWINEIDELIGKLIIG